MQRRHLSLIALLVLFLVPSAQSWAAYTVYFKLDGLPGLCTQAQHRGWFEGRSFSCPIVHEPDGLLMPSSTVEIIRPTDDMSPAIMDACARGRKFDYAAVALRKTGKGAPTGDYFIATLCGVVISGYFAASGDAGTGEHLSLAFGKVMWQYRQPNPDATLGPIDCGAYNGTTGRCYPSTGYSPWTGRTLGTHRLPLPMPEPFPVMAYRAVRAGE
ncbi:MAG: type VI secretion system tube protein Hcp [Armatimonadia bacterium]